MRKPTMDLQEDPRGQLTGADLGDTDCLFLPPEDDPFGIPRRPLTLAGMRLSLELARMAYTLNVAPWMRAGWTDFSIQVDNQLTTGVKAREEDGLADRAQAVIGSLKVKRARLQMVEPNPLSQLTGALRQRGESDTIKAVVMARKAAAGRYVVAIGFMGTGMRFYDWISNFRLGTEDGFHKGFAQLTQAFAKNETLIQFPDTAEALGLEKLTLSDILTEMQQDTGRFSLWMAGHSQGAAVMQAYCSRLLHGKKIAGERIFGCGFASPTVAVSGAAAGGERFPLYHVLNADDLVPRMGAAVHFGLCLQFSPDEAFRGAAYGWSRAPQAVTARKAAERLTLHITDTPSFLTAFAALLVAIREEKPDDELFGNPERLLSFGPIDRVVTFAGKKAKERLQGMIAYLQKAYAEITGNAMDEATVRFLAERCRPIVVNMPIRSLLSALFERLYPPHSLVGRAGGGGYLRIVNEEFARLTPFLWREGGGAPPRRLYAKGFYGFRGTAPAVPPRKPCVSNKRTRTRPRRRAIHLPR